MKQYDFRCPICGTVNKDLYLDETDGWMECEHCGSVVQLTDTTLLESNKRSFLKCRIAMAAPVPTTI